YSAQESFWQTEGSGPSRSAPRRQTNKVVGASGCKPGASSSDRGCGAEGRRVPRCVVQKSIAEYGMVGVGETDEHGRARTDTDGLIRLVPPIGRREQAASANEAVFTIQFLCR